VQEQWKLSTAQHWPHIGGPRQQQFIISRQREPWWRRWGRRRYGAAPTRPHLLLAGQARPHRDCGAAWHQQGLQQVGSHSRLFDDTAPPAGDVCESCRDLWSYSRSLSRSCFTTDGQLVSMSWCWTPLWGPWPDFSISFFFCRKIALLFVLDRPLWREDRCIICSAICRWSESRRTHNHTLPSHLRLIRFPFRRLLRLTGITVEVFWPASTRGKLWRKMAMLSYRIVLRYLTTLF
jgi:hypothetical protein